MFGNTMPGDMLAEMPPVPVFLAPATMNITPVSSKPGNNKQIAMQFIQSSREVQQQMLRDPNVAKAILQTLGGDAPQQQAGPLASLLGALGPGAMPMGMPGAPPPPSMPLPPHVQMAIPPPPVVGALPQGGSWSGSITLARNKGKRLPMRSVLLHGRVSDVEVALRSAATSFGALDITHRVPFEEVAKRASTCSLLTMMPNTPAEFIQYEEYTKYFRLKNRAGVAKLDGELSLYVLPCCDDIPILRDSVYALNPAIIPRSNCLLGLISSSNEQLRGDGQGPQRAPPLRAEPVAAPVEPAAAALPVEPAAAEDEEANAAAAVGAAEDADRDEAGEEAGEDDLAQAEILNLFSNPELLKLLSDDGPAAES